MIRGIITSVIEGVIKRFSASGRQGEQIDNREYMQHYGFTSRPLTGAEAVIIKDGNHILMIASDDRRYRIGIEDGEVCLYTDEGDFIHFKRDKLLHISTGNKLLINATNDVEINTQNATVNASVKADVVSPTVNLGAAAGTKKLPTEDFVTLFNNHKHNNGAVPDQQAGAAHQTTKVKAI